MADLEVSLFEGLPTRELGSDIFEQDPSGDAARALDAENVAEPAQEEHHNTDLGNAKRLVKLFNGDFKYSGALGWLAWDGKRWKKNSDLKVKVIAHELGPLLYKEAAKQSTQANRLAMSKHAAYTESSRGIKSMLELAQDRPEIAINVEELDNNRHLLTVKNGTLNLKTRTLKPHDRNDLITKLADVDYDKTAEAPNWLEFQKRITKGDQSVQDYKAMAFAYSLLGNPKEHCFFICWGTGANGKSTEIETIASLASDYATATKFETFIERQGEAIRNDLAALAGARLVYASEGSIGQRLSEGTVKALAGGDKITARFLRKEYFSFTPTFVIWVSTNHRPVIRGTDNGIWRRIRLLPYTEVIPDEEQDKDLKDKLNEERSGILNWVIKGAEMYFASGLPTPKAVEEATEDYRDSQDVLGEFLADYFRDEPGGFVSRKNVRDVYLEWCDNKEERPWQSRPFNEALRERRWAEKTVRGVRGWADKVISHSFV